MPEIEIDSQSGFCFGVVTAIRKAEEELSKSGILYCLGDIVHNSDEVERLRLKGLVTITHEQMERLRNVKVLLRAHGEPPSTYEMARRNGIEIIDATCPVVLQLQRRIKRDYDAVTPKPQIVIYGKNGHAEVNGLVGQTHGEAIVVEGTADIGKIDLGRDIWLYSQTTKSIQGLRSVIEEIGRRKSAGAELHSADTICRQVANRVGHLREFASGHEVILFVAGRKSSNGRILYNECKAVNPRTYLISNEEELCREWLADARSIGVCGATSTPRWLMEKISDAVRRVLSDNSAAGTNG